MLRKFRVAIADADPHGIKVLQDILAGAGHQVVFSTSTAEQLVRSCGASQPELLISDVRLLDGDSLPAIAAVSQTLGIPAIVTSNDNDDGSIDRTAECHVSGLLLKPIREIELAAMIAIASSRYREFLQLRTEASTLRRALDDRKIIEQAKGVVMKKCALDEDGAFRHLQHLARQHRQKLIDVSKSVLLAENAFVR
jgi:two-component system, response regulator PdtaR